MPITLPSGGFVQAVPRFMSFSTTLTPNLGGEEQQINRPGSRFALDITLPPRLYAEIGDAGAMKWISKLNQAKEDEALFAFPQPGLVVEAAATPRVNGALQAGTSLIADGFTSGWSYRDGQFISILHNGDHYLHHFTADGTLAGTSGTLPIFPMLRVEPDDNALIFTDPAYIQGAIEGDSNDWTINRMKTVGIQFSIREKR